MTSDRNQKLACLLTVAIALSAAAASFLLPHSTPAQLAKGLAYSSFCNDTDIACIQRELNFIIKHKRTPITDSELIKVYELKDERQLFDGNHINPIKRRLPVDVLECEDCEILTQ